MSKKLSALALTVAFSAAAFATVAPKSIGLAALNQEIVKLLAPFQNPDTSATVTFQTIETNAKNTEKFNVIGFFTKKGPKGSFELNVDELSYDYNNLVKPTSVGKAQLKTDLTALIQQQDLNEIFKDFEGTLNGYAKDLIARYNGAATFDVKVSNQKNDQAGNFVSLDAVVDVNIDFAKLPTQLPIEDEYLQQLKVAFSVNAKEGFTFDAKIVMNPKYRGFKDDQAGMKETLEKLLAADPETLEQISSLIQYLDDTASGALN